MGQAKACLVSLKGKNMARYEWNSKYILQTDNANLAVSLIDMKAYLRIDTTADDALITSLIKSATKLAEQYASIEILDKTFTMYLDFFPFNKVYGNSVEENFNSYSIQVKRSKLISTSHIKYYSGETLLTLDDALYSFSKDNEYSRIYLVDDGTLWPNTDNRKQAVEIEFVAGNGEDDTKIPENLKTAIKRIVAYLYENRGDCVTGCDVCVLAGAASILNLESVLEI